MNILITDLDYTIENNELYARVFGRSETGTREIVKIRGTRPFFCVNSTEEIPDDYRITEIRKNEWTSLKGKPLTQIFVQYPHDVAKRVKCKVCNGEGKVIIEKFTKECIECSGDGQVEIGLKSKFKETYQADIVYTQVLRIYYRLNGTINVPSNLCHISEIKPSTVKIQPLIDVFDIETIDSVDTLTAPEPIPCLTVYDNLKNIYHVFCYGFKKYELLQVKIRLQHHWMQNLIPKLQKYNFSNPTIVFHDFDNPKSMMGSFISFKRMQNPDIIAPWNKTFDMPYIYQYMKNLSLPVDALSETNKTFRTKDDIINIEGTTEIDIMETYAYLQPQELRSKSLEYCANKEFNVGKMKRSSIKEMRQKDPVGLLAYNIVDVQLSYALMQECQIFDNMQTISNISNAGLDNQSPLRIIDSFIMTYLRDRKIAVPTNVHTRTEGKKEGGAFVHAATIGKHNNVIILDFKGYYTSVMMDGNVCASTNIIHDELPPLPDAELKSYIHNNLVHCPNGAMFRKDKTGIIPEILIHVRDERNRHKKLMKLATDEQSKSVEDKLQSAFKRIGNIFYGQFKNPYFRLMDKAIAEAITSVCKELTIRVIEILEKINIKNLLIQYKLFLGLPENDFEILCSKLNTHLKIVYGDTDSLFIKLSNILVAKELTIIGQILEKHINSLLPALTKEMFNIDNKYIEIEFDNKKRMQSFIQMPSKTDKSRGAKKRYVCLVYNDDNKLDLIPHFTGMDVIRSDTAPLMAEIQTKVSSMILTDRPYKELETYLKSIYTNFNKQPIDSLLIKETIHAFNDAKSHSPQLIGAMYANKYMSKSFKSGVSVYYIYLKSFPSGYPHHIQTKKWGLQEVKTLCLNYNESVPSNFIAHIDWEKMRELVIEKPVETLLEAVGYKWSDILSGTKTNKIKTIIIPTETPKS